MPAEIKRSDYSSTSEYFNAYNMRDVEVANVRSVAETGAMAVQFIVGGDRCSKCSEGLLGTYYERFSLPTKTTCRLHKCK